MPLPPTQAPTARRPLWVAPALTNASRKAAVWVCSTR
jgi:hypothetical protein